MGNDRAQKKAVNWWFVSVLIYASLFLSYVYFFGTKGLDASYAYDSIGSSYRLLCLGNSQTGRIQRKNS